LGIQRVPNDGCSIDTIDLQLASETVYNMKQYFYIGAILISYNGIHGNARIGARARDIRRWRAEHESARIAFTTRNNSSLS